MCIFGLLAKIMNMKLQRAGTLLVVLKSESGGIFEDFEVLKRCGVRPAEHLTAVQVLPGARWDVQCNIQECRTQGTAPVRDREGDRHRCDIVLKTRQDRDCPPRPTRSGRQRGPFCPRTIRQSFSRSPSDLPGVPRNLPTGCANTKWS